MMKAIAFQLLLVTLLVLALPPAATGGAETGQPAPAFALPDAEGKTHELAGAQGKWVVLEWVNFDCPFVRKHYRSGNLPSLQKTYTEKGVVWYSVCSSAPGKQGYFEGQELLDRITEEKSAPSAYLLDPDGTVGKAYGAKTTPHIFIINPEGVLVYAGGIDDIASTDREDIAKAKNYVRVVLDAGLAGKEITVSGSKPYGCSVKYK